MPGAEKLKAKCFKCGVNKWIVDFKEGCAANISTTSKCLSCLQGEKIEKLERIIREKDSEMEKMKHEISKLEKKVNDIEMLKGANDSRLGNKRVLIDADGAQDGRQPLGLEVKLEKLSMIVKENRDSIVETGKEIVEVRQDMATLKSKTEFNLVKGKKAAKFNKQLKPKEDITLSNRFSLLALEDDDENLTFEDEGETILIGDSMVRGQGKYFVSRNKRKRWVKTMPGSGMEGITKSVQDLKIRNRNSNVIVQAGGNDLFLKYGQVGQTEKLLREIEKTIEIVKSKTDNGVIVGLLPREKVSDYALSKAIAINERTRAVCRTKGIRFLNFWDYFAGKKECFNRDGIHLNERGMQMLGNLYHSEVFTCTTKVEKDSRKAEVYSKQEKIQCQKSKASFSEELDYSFEGFPDSGNGDCQGGTRLM